MTALGSASGEVGWVGGVGWGRAAFAGSASTCGSGCWWLSVGVGVGVGGGGGRPFLGVGGIGEMVVVVVSSRVFWVSAY